MVTMEQVSIRLAYVLIAVALPNEHANLQDTEQGTLQRSADGTLSEVGAICK